MSVVNISSENALGSDQGEKSTTGKYNNCEFEVVLKKPLLGVKGVSLLNATIPLTYNVINSDNQTLNFIYYFSAYSITIPVGNYTPDELADELEELMNLAVPKIAFGDTTRYPRITKNQKELHIENKARNILVGDLDILTYADAKSTKTTINKSELEVGMQIKQTVTNKYYNIQQVNTDGSIVATPDALAIALGDYRLEARGFVVNYDPVKEKFIFQYDEGFSINGYQDAVNPNTERMLKVLGFRNKTAVSSSVTNNIFTGDDYLESLLHPELQGPSALYLRVISGMLLDSQNSETYNNDRILIPLIQEHGGIEQYIGQDSDVIPLSIPCDIYNLKFRLEYGDTNDLLGGATDNLNGHHIYLRLKFHFK